ncbi:MAG: Uma2 family endonuclease [Ardenticatenaceae bacterium]
MTITRQKTGLITGEELWQMGDIGPCELIDGRIVANSPTGGRHAQIEQRLGRFLATFVEGQGIGFVLVGEVGIYTRRNPDRVRGLDVAVFSNQRLPQGVPDGYIEAAPELVVEIMSPGDRWEDVRAKLKEYFAIGVTWVWIVEPRKRRVIVYSSETEMQEYDKSDIVSGEGILTGFSRSVAELFAD